MTQNFQQELAVYNASLIDLLAYAGRYVVIRGAEIHGPFAGPEQAWGVGRTTYGQAPFLVKRIQGEATLPARAG